MICSLKKFSGLEECCLQLMLTAEIAPTSTGSHWSWNSSIKVQLQNEKKKVINLLRVDLKLYSIHPWYVCLWSTTASRCHCLESVELTRKNISRTEALTIFQNLQLPLGHPFKLSDISADNNPAHAGHRNPVLFTSCRRCYVPRLQTQLFRKTSREMQYLLLRITGQ